MSVERILPEDARKLLEEGDGYAYLDVRTTEEFAAGHVPSAVNVPLLERNPEGPGLLPNPRFVDDVCARFAREDRIITGCLRGARSLKAAELLVAQGFTNITDMRGGWDGEVDRAGRIRLSRLGAARLSRRTGLSGAGEGRRGATVENSVDKTMPRVCFTRHLERFFPELGPEEVRGASVYELLSSLECRHPGLRGYLVDEQGALRPHVNIFIGGCMLRDRQTLSDPVEPDDEVHILQALSGGL